MERVIGAITMRFGSVTPLTVKGANKAWEDLIEKVG